MNMTLKDSAMHKSYHTIRKKKKFVPVSEDYLYKRKKGVKTYRTQFMEKKKLHKDAHSYYENVLKKRAQKKKKYKK